MTTLCRQVRRVALVGLAVMAVGGAAAAQSQGGQTGRLMLEEIDNGWLISPDFRVTELEGETTQVAGVYGGWLMDHRFLIGAGAYWLVDGPNDTDLKYFGPVVGWSTNLGDRFDVSLRGLVGFGTATRRFDLDGAPDGFGCPRFPCHGKGFPAFGRYRDDFFIAEPHVSLFTRVTGWLGVKIGAAYRFTGKEFDIGHGLDGASVSFGVRLGQS